MKNLKYYIDKRYIVWYYIVIRYTVLRYSVQRYSSTKGRNDHDGCHTKLTGRNQEVYLEEAMNDQEQINQYLPLTESTYYILLALAAPLHGYGVMQKVETLSEGTVKIGPGTLYGAFQALEKVALIIKIGEEERRKIYTLTNRGRAVLNEQLRRLEIMVRSGSTSGLNLEEK
jgi:DNA-binding PadR family transcriptional regulator